MTPDLRLWFLTATALLYGALFFRLCWTGAATRWRWFAGYCALACLKTIWWLAAGRIPWIPRDHSFYPDVDAIAMLAKGMVVLEAFWLVVDKQFTKWRLLTDPVLASFIFVAAWHWLPVGVYTPFPQVNRLRLAAHLGMLFLALAGLAMQPKHSGRRWRWLEPPPRDWHLPLLAAYLACYVAAGLYDYRIFAVRPEDPESWRRFYFELSWFLPLRGACLVGWFKTVGAGMAWRG